MVVVLILFLKSLRLAASGPKDGCFTLWESVYFLLVGWAPPDYGTIP